jgi:hypothetical protein
MRDCNSGIVNLYSLTNQQKQKLTIEIEVERLNRDIDPKRAVLEFASPVPRNNSAILELLH